MSAPRRDFCLADFSIDAASVLHTAGLKVQRSGRELRIPATWRDSKGHDVSIRIWDGVWKDHGGDQRGGNWRALCDLLGIDSGLPAAKWQPPKFSATTPAPAPRPEKESDESERIALARRVYSHSTPLTQSDDRAVRAMLHYLQRERGVGALVPRLHAAGVRAAMLAPGKGEAKAPALVCPILHPDSLALDTSGVGAEKITGVQREWGRGASKKMLGPHFSGKNSGGLVIPAAADGPRDALYVTEGLMTGASVALMTGAAVLALFDVGGLAAFPAPFLRKLPAGMRIIIAGDHDQRKGEPGKEKRAGEDGAEKCAARIHDLDPRRDVRISIPETEGQDWADVLQTRGAEAGRAMLARLARMPRPPEPKIQDLSWRMPWTRIEGSSTDAAPEVSLEAATPLLRAAISDALQCGADGKAPTPTIIMVTAGVGKTREIIEQVSRSDKPFLILAPTLALAAEIAAAIPGAKLHEGRNEDNCYLFSEIAALTKQRRAPFAHRCRTCPHGKPDAAEPCGYMPALRDTVYHRVIVAAHGAGAEDSLLYSFVADPENPNITIDRGLICDESPATDSITIISAAEMHTWRAARDAALSHISESERVAGMRDGLDPETAGKRRRAAEAWMDKMLRELDQLAVALASAPADHKLHPLSPEIFSGMVGLGKKIPEMARSVDASVLEIVEWRRGEKPIIPLRAIETLAQAIERGTAWFRGGEIVAVTPTPLWTQIIQRGGLLLDATPSLRQRREVAATGGKVHEIRVEQPRLKIVQYGPSLHGRGNLAGENLAREARTLNEIAGNDPVITHRPLALELEDRRGADRQFRYWWRDERGHNDWARETRLILWGPPLRSPQDQLLQYQSDRAALRAVGVMLADWDGAAEKNQIIETTDGWRRRVPTYLPTCPDARMLVLDRIGADVAQAVARLRSVRAGCGEDSRAAVTVEFYGFFPLSGHGLRVDEIRLESQGRAHQRVEIAAAVGEGVSELGEDRTRRGLSDFVFNRTGKRPSNTTLDNLIDEIRIEARAGTVSLTETARSVCRAALILLRGADGDHDRAVELAAGQIPSAELLLWMIRPAGGAATATAGPHILF